MSTQANNSDATSQVNQDESVPFEDSEESLDKEGTTSEKEELEPDSISLGQEEAEEEEEKEEGDRESSEIASGEQGGRPNESQEAMSAPFSQGSSNGSGGGGTALFNFQSGLSDSAVKEKTATPKSPSDAANNVGQTMSSHAEALAGSMAAARSALAQTDPVTANAREIAGVKQAGREVMSHLNDKSFLNYMKKNDPELLKSLNEDAGKFATEFDEFCDEVKEKNADSSARLEAGAAQEEITLMHKLVEGIKSLIDKLAAKLGHGGEKGAPSESMG